MLHENPPPSNQLHTAELPIRRCGRPDGDAWAAAAVEPIWASLRCTFGGLWEIDPQALAEVLPAGRVQVVDVREAGEFDGPLGHIASARLVPLGGLQDAIASLDRERPVVAVCRSGSRSARAVVMLQQAGFAQVANLAGGMLRWRVDGGLVDNGQD